MDRVHSTLISTATLAAHRAPDWTIVDCRYDLNDQHWGRAQYRAAHIPGAVYASLGHDLAATPDGSNGRHPMPSPQAMVATFGRLGISADNQVVLYDQDNGMYASRLWWMLRYMGHEARAVLDGGWAKWTREGRPTSGDDETRRPAQFRGHPRQGLRLDVADVERLVAEGGALLVDARAPERFEGQVETLDRLAGHIPGAANHYFMWNAAADGTILPPEQLRERFEHLLGGRAPDTVVMYCGSGVTACQNLLAMEHAGLGGGTLYPGSWSEWSSDPSRPVATGPATVVSSRR
jgi:thiosulfate/3-mercaptopyruvate sulfurtransferase